MDDSLTESIKDSVSYISVGNGMEDESKFDLALSTLLAENNWKMVSTRTGKYKIQFKSSLNYKERINILEIVLEDIRERYLDLRVEYRRMRRKNGQKHKKKKKKI